MPPGHGGDSFGGGLYSASGGVAVVINTTVSGNYAGAGGRSGSFAVGGNGLLNGTGAGGGIYLLTGTAKIHNDTVVENQTLNSGGGIRYDGTGSFDLVSTIVGQNDTIAGFNTGVTGRDVYINNAGATVTANHDLIETTGGHNIAGGTNSNIVGTPFLDGSGTNTVYSQLVNDPTTGTDYHPLTVGSVAIAAGANVAGDNRTTDQLGNNLGSPPNIGSVETVINPGSGDTQPPTAPTNLTASKVTSTSLTLNWTASTDNVAVVDYLIFMRQGTTGSFTQIGSTNAATTTFGVTGLVPSTGYQFFVVAQDAVPNTSAHSSTLSVTTGGDTQAPTAPTNLTASNITSGGADLSWTAATDNVGVTEYDVFMSQAGGSFTQIGSTNGTTTSFSVTGLSPSTQYSFFVQAKDAAGNTSPQSNTVDVTTTTGSGDSTPPTAPTNLTASNTTSNGTDLSWTASTDNVGVTGYIIFGQQGSGPVTQFGSTNGTTTSFSVTGLLASTQYSFFVQAKDAAGNTSPQSNTVDVTTTTGSGDSSPPTAPTNLIVTATTTSTVSLSWTASNDNVGVTGYLVFFRQGSTGTFTQAGTTTTTSFTVNGLSANTLYNFYVVARDAADNVSAQSGIVPGTTAASGASGALPIVASTANGLVRFMDPTSGTIFRTVQPCVRYTKLVSVAEGDVNGDGVEDIICATRGVKNGRIKVYDGAAAMNGQAVVISRFKAFSDYTGGLTVAAADVNGDGKADIVVGTGKTAGLLDASGNPMGGRVEVLSGAKLPAAQANADIVAAHMGAIFNPFGSYNQGIYVAAGDVDGDGRAEVIVSTGSGTSQVAGFSLSGGKYIQTVTLTSPFGGVGTQVTTLDLNGDGQSEIAVGALQANGNVTVKVYTGAGVEEAGYRGATNATNFGLGSVRLANSTIDELMVGSVPIGGTVGGAGADQISILDPLTGNQSSGFDAFAALVGGCALSAV